MILYRTPGRSFTRPPRTSTIECSCRLWPMPGMYAVTSTPVVSRTRATLRSAEFGFFGVVVNTRVQTPRRWGEPFSAAGFNFVPLASRPFRTSCAIVGTRVPLIRPKPTGETSSPPEFAAGLFARREFSGRRLRCFRRRVVGRQFGLTGVAAEGAFAGRRELGLGPAFDATATGEDADVGFGLTRRARLPQPCREVHLFFDLGRVERQRLVFGGLGLDVAIQRHARAGRDQLADDHVLLQTLEAVGTALDRGFGEHARGLLERRRRQPRIGGQRRLRDAHQLGPALGRTLAFLDELAVLLRVTAGIHLLSGQEAAVAGL